MTRAAVIAALIDQIARDTATLRGDRALISPSADFYKQRIAAYRAEVVRLQAEPSTASNGTPQE